MKRHLLHNKQNGIRRVKEAGQKSQVNFNEKLYTRNAAGEPYLLW